MAVTVHAATVARRNNLYKLWNRLSSGSHFPPPVRRVDIRKQMAARARWAFQQSPTAPGESERRGSFWTEKSSAGSRADKRCRLRDRAGSVS